MHFFLFLFILSAWLHPQCPLNQFHICIVVEWHSIRRCIFILQKAGNNDIFILLIQSNNQPINTF